MSNENGNQKPKTINDLTLADRAEITLEDVHAMEAGLEQQLQQYKAMSEQLALFGKEIEMTRAAINMGKMILGGQMPSQQAKANAAKEAAQAKQTKRNAKRKPQAAETA